MTQETRQEFTKLAKTLDAIVRTLAIQSAGLCDLRGTVRDLPGEVADEIEQTYGPMLNDQEDRLSALGAGRR